ncbi:MAG TPA: hypothetical protein VMB50_24600 [Myxococcales bacterium]|nr:hypothetical protein [Myxococcales bacterium]
MRCWALVLGGLLAACSGSGSGADGGASCTLDSQCPQIGCQCSGGANVPSACLCEGGRAATGCGPGGVCAGASDCEQACAQEVGLGGTTGGSGGNGGGPLCDNDSDCQPVQCTCPDAGSTALATYCVQGQCEPATSCPSC